ncbi:hypothetical protein ACWEBX_16955 [Streptomyces sp. NPDC005070]
MTKHQDAALAGDADARRSIREAQALFATAAPESARQQHTDRARARAAARRSIA